MSEDDYEWESYTTISMLMDVLVAAKPHHILRPGISHPHSYRGYYDQAAVELIPECTVAEAMVVVIVLLTETFEGWKGGEFSYDGSTPLWAATEGSTGPGFRIPAIYPY